MANSCVPFCSPALLVMTAQIRIHDNEPPIAVENDIQLENALRSATDEARSRDMLAAIGIKAGNGNEMTIVVGGEETVLSFNFGHLDPPYYASKGNSDEDQPVMTCYLNFKHHTEFPRKSVIPIAGGIAAVKEFLGTGELPDCVKWEEV